MISKIVHWTDFSDDSKFQETKTNGWGPISFLVTKVYCAIIIPVATNS